MPICNTDNFISQLQTKINTIAGDSCPWCQISEFRGNFAIKTDGTLWTWGCNICGSLGDGTTVARCSPGTVAGGGTTWCQFSSDYCHTAAIKTDGTLWTWGSNAQGRLGDGTTLARCSPGTVAGGGTTWCQSSNGSLFTGAIKTDGTLWTWGNNLDGTLGDGTTVTRCSPGTVAGGGTNWCQVAASKGGLHFAAIKTDGTLWSWGCNSLGQLGDGTQTFRCSPGTVAGGGTTWCQVSNGYGHNIAIKTDGTIWTWGFNAFGGRLGDGTTISRSSPGTVAGGGTNWCKVSAGNFHSVAIKTDGTIWTWGNNSSGGLGDGTTVSRCSPGTVAGGGTNWCQVAGQFYQTSAIKTDGTLWTWGCNICGSLGDGTAIARCSPGSVAIAPVASAEDFLLYAEAIAQVTDNRKVSIASSSSLPDPLGNGIPTGQMVFLEDRLIPVIANGHDWDGLDGRALVTGPKYCLFSWGSALRGALGDGTTVSRCSPGTIAGGGTTWCCISAMKNFSALSVMAIKTDGTLWSWGSNFQGRLGDGTATTVSKCSPGTVAGGGTTWCQVSSGYQHVAAIKCDGTLWTWGANSGGRLGNGTTLERCSPGTIVNGGTNWCQVSGGRCFSAAIKCDGTLWTWGSGGFGELGDGTTVSRCSPGTIAGAGTNWCNVSSGSKHVAAIKTDGTLWTWGCNGVGELGDGTTVSRCSPGTVWGSYTTWCQIFSGIYAYKNAAIKTDGTLWTWGFNTNGTLGDGTVIDRCSPGTVAGGGTNWCQVSVGHKGSAAIKTDGTLWTWGCNRYGKLGDGTILDRCSPGTTFGSITNWCQVSTQYHTIAITRQ